LWHSIHALFGNCDHKKRKKNKGQKPCFLAVKWYLDSSTEKKKSDRIYLIQEIYIP